MLTFRVSVGAATRESLEKVVTYLVDGKLQDEHVDRNGTAALAYVVMRGMLQRLRDMIPHEWLLDGAGVLEHLVSNEAAKAVKDELRRYLRKHAADSVLEAMVVQAAEHEELVVKAEKDARHKREVFRRDFSTVRERRQFFARPVHTRSTAQ